MDQRHRERPPARLVVAVPPIARTLLEGLMTTAFIFEDPGPRLDWYYRSGWCEAALLQKTLDSQFASRPEWAAKLDEHRAWVAHHIADLSLTPVEIADPKQAVAKTKWWPNPGRMKDIARGGTADFLKLVNLKFYGELSADAHLSYMGLVRRGGILRPEQAHNIEDVCSVSRSQVLRRVALRGCSGLRASRRDQALGSGLGPSAQTRGRRGAVVSAISRAPGERPMKLARFFLAARAPWYGSTLRC